MGRMAVSTGPLVLVVEDYQDAREMYAAYLQFSGYRVAEASNGLEAVEKARELLPAIILMDLALPKMDGWEATRLLKADERTRHIPIVALTGHALAGHAEGARQAGCDAFVTKPCLAGCRSSPRFSGCWRREPRRRHRGQRLPSRAAPTSPSPDFATAHFAVRTTAATVPNSVKLTTSVEHEAPGRREDPPGARQ